MHLSLDDPCIVSTARLDLRQMVRTDAPALFLVLADPELYVTIGGSPPKSASALAEVIAGREVRRFSKGDEVWLNWLVTERNSGKAIGYLQATISTTRTRVGALF